MSKLEKLSKSCRVQPKFCFHLKKCKQTAEISWLFFWDVKISKNFVKQKFSISCPYVTAYLHLFSATTQQPKFLRQYPVLLFTAISKWKIILRQFFDILFVITQFLILWKKIEQKSRGPSAKFEKTTKQAQNQQIFFLTLTKMFSVPD